MPIPVKANGRTVGSATVDEETGELCVTIEDPNALKEIQLGMVGGMSLGPISSEPDEVL